MAKNKGKKLPVVREQPSAGYKTPRVEASATSFYGERPSWSFARLDIGSEWCVSKIDISLIFDDSHRKGFGRVLARLSDFESMTWSEIIGPRHHAIPFEDLSDDARKRLEDLEVDDVDELMSLRVTSAERVFGIRKGATLAVLWWDPKHEVCPSKTYRQ